MIRRSPLTLATLPAVALVLMFWTAGGAKDFAPRPQADCGYYMCQYEKQNIDAIILAHARESKTVMFGEIHDSVVAGTPPPVEDSCYVITLLGQLKAMGYGYLALEVQTDAPRHTHSYDMLRCLADYRNGKPIDSGDYPFAKPGWVELMLKALETGFQPVFFDRTAAGADRDAEMFRAIKEKVFDRDADARVLVYVGANHVSELADQGTFSRIPFKRKPLGLLLSNFTHGRNYSIYIGYPDDTPSGCDLIISRFVWDTFSKSLHRLQPSSKSAAKFPNHF